MQDNIPHHDLEAEAKAFDDRMIERDNAGFIPDIRDGVKCDYFYKSCFRDPHFFKLYCGTAAGWFTDALSNHGQGLNILDVGCGPGFISLEVARAGHHVTAIDISQKSIDLAQKALDRNKYKDGFGSLTYKVMPFEEVRGTYDALIFSGALHHFENISEQIELSLSLLKPGGLLICHEPCHEQFRKEDAAQVAMMRSILSITGHWYEDNLYDGNKDVSVFDQHAQDVYDEYFHERDKHEVDGQSPNDNSVTGEELIVLLNQRLTEIEYKKGFSFIYRFLGGLRGADEIVHKLADLFKTYDRYSVKNGYMNPNQFFYVGKKSSN